MLLPIVASYVFSAEHSKHEYEHWDEVPGAPPCPLWGGVMHGVVQMEGRPGMAQLTWVSCGTPCSGSAKSGMSSRRPAMLLNCGWQAWGPNCREAAGKGFCGRGGGGGGRQELKSSCVSWLRGFTITYVTGLDAERVLGDCTSCEAGDGCKRD